MTLEEVIKVLSTELKCIDRNNGINCDRKCESCDLVMDVGAIREAYSMAISALREQDLQPTYNQLATDTISRQAAIDALENTECELLPEEWDELTDAIMNVPSTQQEEAIPATWLEEQAKWFESMDNAFAKIEANNIRVMIKKWRSEKDERSD